MPINSQRWIDPGKMILTAQIAPCQKAEAESSHSPPQTGECHESESATHSLLHRPHQGLAENINGGRTPHMEVHNVCFSQLTDDGQLGWMADGWWMDAHSNHVKRQVCVRTCGVQLKLQVEGDPGLGRAMQDHL